MRDRLTSGGNWAIYPPIRWDYKALNLDPALHHPSLPSAVNWLGMDDRGRDAFARLLYGFRVSIFCGLILACLGTVLGILRGPCRAFSSVLRHDKEIGMFYRSTQTCFAGGLFVVLAAIGLALAAVHGPAPLATPREPADTPPRLQVVLLNGGGQLSTSGHRSRVRFGNITSLA